MHIYIRLSRPKNLVMIFIMMTLTKYKIIDSTIHSSNLSLVEFLLFSIGLLCITAGGYVVNDIYDVVSDTINKPEKQYVGKEISQKNAWLFYFLTNVIGLLSVLVVAFLQKKYEIIFTFIVLIGCLYLYSKFLKGMLLVGNILVSILVASPIVMLFYFDVNQQEHSNNILSAIYLFFTSLQISLVIFSYTIFAFLTTLIRELIKDIEDVNGDYAQGLKTLPVLIGRNRSKYVALVLSSVLFLFIIYIIKYELITNYSLLIYAIATILVPLGYFIYILSTASNKNEYQYLSKLLKYIMFFGIVSMIFI